MLAFVNLCSPTESEEHGFCFLKLLNLCSPTESEEHGFCFLNLSVHCVGCRLQLDHFIFFVSAVGLNWIIALALAAVRFYEPV